MAILSQILVLKKLTILVTSNIRKVEQQFLQQSETPLVCCNPVIVRLSLLRKTILIPEYLAFMCVCVFVDGCISQF